MEFNITNLKDTFVTLEPENYILKNPHFISYELNKTDKLFDELKSFREPYGNLNKKNLLGIGFYKKSEKNFYSNNRAKVVNETIKYIWNPFVIQQDNLINLVDPSLRRKVEIVLCSKEIKVSRKIIKNYEVFEEKPFWKDLLFWKSEDSNIAQSKIRKPIRSLEYISFEINNFKSLDKNTIMLDSRAEVFPLYLDQYKKIEKIMEE